MAVIRFCFGVIIVEVIKKINWKEPRLEVEEGVKMKT